MNPNASIPQDPQWQDRARALAEARRLTGTAHYAGANDAGDTLVKVPSSSVDGEYGVWIRTGGRIECPCQAGQYGRPCAHAGAALAYRAAMWRATHLSERDAAGYQRMREGIR